MHESKASEAKTGDKLVVVRMVILFALLAACLVAAAYEFGYARAQSFDAIVKIDDLDGKLLQLGQPTTDADIQKVIGFAPIREQPDRNTLVERYRWTSVVPFRTHELWVLYQQGIDGRWLHLTHGLNSPPELISDALPPPESPPAATSQQNPPEGPAGPPLPPNWRGSGANEQRRPIERPASDD